MRYELKLAKLIEKGSRINDLPDDLPVEVLAVMGYLGSLEKTLKAFEERAKIYPLVGTQAAVIVRVPLQLMETVVVLNKSGSPPLELVQMLKDGHLGRWRSNGSLKESFVLARGSFPISKAVKFN